MRFLVKDSFRERPTEEVMALVPAEQARVKELTEQGVIEALYLAADMSVVWIIWNCESQADLEEVHKTLPLHAYLDCDITLLADRA